MTARRLLNAAVLLSAIAVGSLAALVRASWTVGRAECYLPDCPSHEGAL